MYSTLGIYVKGNILALIYHFGGHYDLLFLTLANAITILKKKKKQKKTKKKQFTEKCF